LISSVLLGSAPRPVGEAQDAPLVGWGGVNPLSPHVSALRHA